jgi:hypothetical protein
MEHFAYYRADANQARKSPVNNGGVFWGGHYITIFSSAKTLVIVANLAVR